MDMLGDGQEVAGKKSGWVAHSHAKEIKTWDFERCLNFLCLSEWAQIRLPGGVKSAQVKREVAKQLSLKLLERNCPQPDYETLFSILNLQRSIIAQAFPGQPQAPPTASSQSAPSIITIPSSGTLHPSLSSDSTVDCQISMQKAVDLYVEASGIIAGLQKENTFPKK